MAIKDQLMIDLKTAMKAKDQHKKATITMLRAAIKQVEVDTREELDDDAIIQIVQKQIKQKKAAYEDFKKAERTDLVEETELEIAILEAYLPEQLSEEELQAMVDQTVNDLGANSMKDMGRVMGVLKSATAGRADGKTLSSLVKKALSQ